MASTACFGVTISALASKAFDQHSLATMDFDKPHAQPSRHPQIAMMFHFFDGFNAAINCNGQLREVFL